MSTSLSDFHRRREHIAGKLADLRAARDRAAKGDRPAMAHACDLAIYLQEAALRQLEADSPRDHAPGLDPRPHA